MIVHEFHLPRYCYSSRSLNDPKGMVIHYVSANPSVLTLQEGDGEYHVETIYRLWVEINLPQDEWGPLLPNNPTKHSRSYASAHFIVGRCGQAYEFVPQGRQAYHAGKSDWNGRSNCNAWTFGLELIGKKGDGFTDIQYNTLALVARDISVKYGWDVTWNTFRDFFTGHEDVAPERKIDPGPLFDWERFRTDFFV